MSYKTRVAQLVEARTAIRLRLDTTFNPIDALIQRRASALGLADIEDYPRVLEQEATGSPEWERLIAVVTNGQTAFYRDRRQMEVVGEAMHEIAATRGRRLSIWCAGCSTGEEPYTVKAIAQLRGLDAAILATDIDVTALSHAIAGRYGAWTLRRFPSLGRDRFIREASGAFEVDAQLREHVTFACHNVALEDPPVSPLGAGFDIILCRNVLIYFEPDRAQAVLDTIASRLAPDGWLFVGPGDALNLQPSRLQAVQIGGRTVFRLTEADVRLPLGSIPPPRRALCSVAELPAFTAAAVAPTFERATTLLAQGDTARAREVLLQVLEQTPSHVPARITLGNVHLSAHRFEQAAEAYGLAHDHAPLLPEIHYLQAVLHKKTGQHEAALEACRRALFLDPDSWPAAALRAGLLLRRPELLDDDARIRVLREVATLEAAVLSERRMPSKKPGQSGWLSSTQGLEGLVPRIDEVVAMCRHHLRHHEP